MKIEKLGIRITELPFEQTIRTDGNEIVIESPLDVTTRRYSAASAAALRDALTVVLDGIAREAADGNDPWDRLEDVPTYVQKVWDSQDDLWCRDGRDGLRRYGAGWIAEDGTRSGPATNQKYGPFRAER